MTIEIRNLCRRKYPIDVEKVTKDFLSTVPPVCLRGLNFVNLCDYPPKFKGQSEEYNKRGGDYNWEDQRWINLYVGILLNPSTKLKFFQKIAIVETLAHELGHHITEFIQQKHRGILEKEQKKAQKYGDRLVGRYLWKKYWWLIWWFVPIVLARKIIRGIRRMLTKVKPLSET